MAREKSHQGRLTRPHLIVGNWKMFKTIAESLQFIESLNKELVPASDLCKIYLAVPYTAINAAAEKAMDTSIVIGAQNMNEAQEGAFTGEVAANMLKEAGARFVIVGHSERRRLFSETNALINKKIRRAIDAGLQPLLCIGETYDEREGGKTHDVLESQLQECLEGISEDDAKSLVISYEPVWAIGTGKAATSEMVAEVHSFIRSKLQSLFPSLAQSLLLLYGGSVTVQNSTSYLAEKEIDGLLIGSASLDPETFAKICKIAQNTTQSIQERV